MLGSIRGPSNLTVRAEYLLWGVEGFHLPPLLTTSSAGTSIDDAGVLGLPTTSVLVGNERQPDEARHGARFTVGHWCDCDETSGVLASYFGLGKETWTYSVDSAQIPILARPFFDVEPGAAAQNSELIAFPGVLEGNAFVEAESTLQGAEILYRHALSRGCCFRLDGLVGYRYAQLDEELRFSDFKRVLSDALGLPIGTTLQEEDRFETRNSFHGAEIGVIGQYCHCGWTIEGMAKVALGNTHSRIGINGQAVFNVPGNPPTVTTVPAGLLAQRTNIGVQKIDDFAAIPEVGVTVGYNVNKCLRATVGYTFMYWSRVARPGDQVDLDLNLTQLEDTGLMGEPRPANTRLLTDLWAQGISFGLEYRM